MQITLNVMQWAYRPSYYLTHPQKWFSELRINIRDIWKRARYGYCSRDVWNLDSWMTAILPPMLRELADDKQGAYPGIEPFDTLEKWHDYLYDLAARFESLQIDWSSTKNPYEETFLNALEKKRISQNNNHTVISYNFDNEEIKELREKWNQSAHDLADLQQQATYEAFVNLSEHFYALWS